MAKKAVALLSGGMDSVTAAAMVAKEGYEIYALTVSYGQRHAREIESAKRLADWLKVKIHEVIDLPISHLMKSALTNPEEDVKGDEKTIGQKIPSTYVPGRNAVLLSIAVSWAESIGADAIVMGINAIDCSGYPDCGTEFIDAYENLIKVASRSGKEGHAVRILAPIEKMSKAQIVKKGSELGVPFKDTWSCYKGSGKPCGECDSCLLRKRGFQEAGMPDPVMAPDEPFKRRRPSA